MKNEVYIYHELWNIFDNAFDIDGGIEDILLYKIR
jgi:hypothetical protein